MLRNTVALTQGEFDIVVVGGGAFGAAAAWDASLRGLKVALIEREDFGGGASAECFKMVHGGIRYLQHADIGRLRSSCHERSAFLRIAPHLVNPLPIVIPTYGHGREGKFFLGTGMLVYDLLTLGRNTGIADVERRIPVTRFMSKHEVSQTFPQLDARGLTGAAIFDDGQMYNPARLVLAFAHSAADIGAVTANYVEATGFLWSGARVTGVRATDRLSGESFDIRGRLVLNAAGPGAEYLLQSDERFGRWVRGPFSRDAYFIVDRKPTSPNALAIPGQSRDRDALVSRAARHLFAVPWRDYTLIGVWHRLFPQHPDRARIEEGELIAWLAEINQSFPALQLRRDEIISSHCGLVPFGDGKTAADELSFGKESRYLDHRQLNGVEGLVTLIGIRYTTARGDAARALDLLLEQMPNAPARAPTERRPLIGGSIENFSAMRADAQAKRPAYLSERSLDALLRNHGSRFANVLKLIQAEPALATAIGASETLAAEVEMAVRHEMAMRLSDVVLRRTDLGSARDPGDQALAQSADIMSRLLSWSPQRRTQEIDLTRTRLREAHATV